VGKNYADLEIAGKKNEVIFGDHCMNINFETAQFLDLDFRGLYDFRTAGRFYNLQKDKYAFIECKQGNEFYWIVIDGEVEFIQEWKEKYYSFDNARKDSSTLWVYRLGKIKGEARISWGKNKEHALARLKKLGKESFKSFEDLLEHNANNLVMDNRIYAGFPWFFQAWTRDELISMDSYNPVLRKKILLNYLQKLLPDGRLPNRLPEADLGSADSIGLYAFRFNKNQKLFNSKEKKRIKEFLKLAKERIDKYYLKDGLIFNKDKETWMDTIKRAGYNIEIQALYANLLFSLGDRKGLNELIKTVRKEFKGKIDNAEHDEVRPNIFLAYYFYPGLFSEEEWKEKFRKVIKESWLEWGGFSTISKNSWLYHPRDEGISDESYHNGNSWYFVNNIAAIALLNFEEFHTYAKKIYEASKKETLASGLLGCSAEISSANQQQSKGCLFQAWSITTLIELNKKIT
jgi:glycogen debranching enzyme